jgi:hypothetical protein
VAVQGRCLGQGQGGVAGLQGAKKEPTLMR